MAFGLTVPALQNYVAGFGGCGINHNTYPLPEAQSDRFLLKIKVNYPTYDEELEIINKYTEVMRDRELKPVISKKMLLELQNITRQVPIANDIKKHIVDIVAESRKKKDLIEYGASPRASIGLVLAAKARALVEGRKYVSKDDVAAMMYPVLRHRIILSFDAERQNLSEDDVIKKLVK
ncbi:MoxR family ATPase [Candidatus Woesearchaeota archaeon]|nr:MoxR family ATPase [Candidatus Woesearchaeota archaeon]